MNMSEEEDYEEDYDEEWEEGIGEAS